MTNDQELRQVSYHLLQERGVSLTDMAELVLFLQNKYIPHLTLEECLDSVKAVLEKREVQNAIITGIELDKLAESNQLSQPLLTILKKDEGLYGIDEIMALSIVNLYGSIGFTNYGYLDKTKPGIVETLNTKDGHSCHTFLDDIVSAIAAAAASRIAHNDPAKSAITNQQQPFEELKKQKL
ncbi:phosphatidylglycerophosphatase A family protein [Streptococcus ictaluri]|uniref:Phosphatidylglycerophosphatase A n=1 Tax=Streptococcus ictaluri 707-05 TaxID=764299 RepID=G5K4S3_9STRE|nr:phosphatidylglycerophosphatase A [Streptococcus ictaluri]EHI68963.1 phosphatidylglycerophosphatase A [Streptococcus ictaluri 707-05]